jgi:hypothetical protein
MRPFGDHLLEAEPAVSRARFGHRHSGTVIPIEAGHWRAGYDVKCSRDCFWKADVGRKS